MSIWFSIFELYICNTIIIFFNSHRIKSVGTNKRSYVTDCKLPLNPYRYLLLATCYSPILTTIFNADLLSARLATRKERKDYEQNAI